MTFTVTLSGGEASEPFKVTPSFTDGTATKGTDYTENTAAMDFQGDSGSSTPSRPDPDHRRCLDKAVSGSLTVTPSFTDGAATKLGDYIENTERISFTGTAGETQTFTVRTRQEWLVEPDETFTVSLTVSGPRRRLRSPTQRRGRSATTTPH